MTTYEILEKAGGNLIVRAVQKPTVGDALQYCQDRMGELKRRTEAGTRVLRVFEVSDSGVGTVVDHLVYRGPCIFSQHLLPLSHYGD